ncbi:MAG: D-glycero-beta-D-manno-heptose-7-phosphate kinase [Candidatus Marinimicrobia bacterium]|nr:D-glycero-beta-D-manno-heptose-7-phosphate kinase [Candidatus Neomarinimicrobiota bacterium]|tara:strand:+ start:3322 stop:4287 length:966 start_codon:yes stop_codon:yes gene_type:complete
MKEKFRELEKIYNSKHLMVVGDVMLDKYIWGAINRISPEAPVPIVDIEKIELHAGGAANVARNISGLGGKVSLVGLIGNDASGNNLKSLLKEDNYSHHFLINDPNRKTTVKTRIIAHNQHVVRLDDESNTILTDNILISLKRVIEALFDKVDGIIIQDYDKGLISPDFISWIMVEAKKSYIPVYVDPKKKYFSCYKGARLFKPNYEEYLSDRSIEIDLQTDAEMYRVDNEYEILLITLGADGMILFTDKNYYRIPTQARAVHDVSGAGDTVIATFALNDVCGIDPNESAILANLAAGKVCEAVGVVPITQKSLKEITEHYQ